MTMTRKPIGYWTEETIISELKMVIKDIGYFPTHNELNNMGISGLAGIIERCGGVNYFREKMGCDLLRKPPGFWTEETIISELKLAIDEANHFPSQNELKIGKNDLLNAISRHGGLNYFREKIGYELLKKAKGYWTKENTTSELKMVFDKLGHFPTYSELIKMGKGDLIHGIQNHGGSNYFMKKYGITPSMRQKYLSKLSSYTNKRGQKSEQFVKDIITEWTNTHNKPIPNCNVKLSKGNIIEFVCELDKKIGIDVTNTKSSKPATHEQIRKKWRHKDYCLYLDELWIVVFTDILTPVDYEKLNQKSPDNVKVFSIEGFLTELDYSTENLDKIDQLNKCTFHNKEEIINHNLFYTPN